MDDFELKSILHGDINLRQENQTCFHLIATQIHQNPEKIALIQGEEKVSYAEFGAIVAGFASRLRKANVSEGQLIPILTSGGIDMIVAMCALWSLDAAFAPVDVHTPPAKRSYILEALGSDVVIVDNASVRLDGYQTISSNSREKTQIDWAKLSEVSVAKQGSIAYGFFTSGSTGEPKCCVNLHAGLANRITHMADQLDLGAGESVLQNSSHIFDSSLWQIFWPLSVGASVVIPKRSSALDLKATISEIKDNNVIISDFVPSIYEKLLQLISVIPEEREKLKSLRYLIVGGESVNFDIVTKSLSLMPWVQLINTYGPTEASIGMVFHHFSGNEGKEIPLGRPIANTQLAIVDEDLNVLNRDEIGEIVISGACLGLGYLNNDEQTHKCFVSNPGIPGFSDTIYRTGDMGRVDRGGLVYFHGREGDQLKLAGVRIELGEIEYHLRKVDAINQVKVVVVNGANQRYLAGFYSADRDLLPSEIKTYLKESLDSVSIPTVLRQVTEFPRTPSGKIDGKQLALSESKSEAPTPDIETIDKQIKRICQMFCPETIDKEDKNLTDFGIDSLGLLSLSFKLQEAFGKEVPFEALISSPTVSDVALLLKQPTLARGKPVTKTEQLNIMAGLNSMVEKISDTQKTAFDTPLTDTILLTGATGYVGANLLSALCRKTSSMIVCIVRANNDRDALCRLFDTIHLTYRLDVDWSRIDAIACDLAELSDPYVESRIIQLRPKCIVHAAAEVDFLKDYEALYPINVEATAKLCEIAVAHDVERFHYISSMSIAGLNDQNAHDASGYAQTKWASDTIIQSLKKKGFPANIYRLGEMMPDENCSCPNELAASVILIRAALAVNAVPNIEEWLDYTPISRVVDHIGYPRRRRQSRCVGYSRKLVASAYSKPNGRCSGCIW